MTFFSQRTTRAMSRRMPLSSRWTAPKSTTSTTTSQAQGLVRTLDLTDLLLYGVGCSVGAGIYALVGLGANLAGPGVALSFLLCGTACIFTSLSYAEFAARIPVTGSAYTYAYVAFGEFVAWVVGWNLTLNYAFSAAAVARSWGEYLANFVRGVVGGLLGLLEGGNDVGPGAAVGSAVAAVIESSEDGMAAAAVDPTENAMLLPWLTRMPLPFFGGYTCSPLSIVIVALCTAVLVTGAKESSRFNNAMTALNMSILAFVLLSGLLTSTIDPRNWSPFLPDGMGGVARGSGLVFFAFIGFDMVACLSEEVKNPQVNMPLGIVGSLILTTLIYVVVSLGVVGMAPVALLGGDVPITNALLANGCCSHVEQLLDDAGTSCLDAACYPVRHEALLWGSRIVSFGAIFGLTTGTFTSLMGQPRIFYKMAQDGLLFKIFSKVNSTTHVPTAGIVITGFLVAFLACFVELEALANLISLGTLQVFTFVDAGVIILRLSPSAMGSRTTSLSSIRAFDEVKEDEEEEETTSQEATQESGSEEEEFPCSGPPLPPIGAPLNAYDEWKMAFVHLIGLGGDTVHENGTKPVRLTVLFTLCATVGSMANTNGWPGFIIVICMLLACFSAIVLVSLPKSLPPDSFECPYVPVVPLIGIASNGYMMGSLPVSSWALIIIWLLGGVAIYFLYGIKHSRLGRQLAKKHSSMGGESSPLFQTQESSGYESTQLVNLNNAEGTK